HQEFGCPDALKRAFLVPFYRLASTIWPFVVNSGQSLPARTHPVPPRALAVANDPVSRYVLDAQIASQPFFGRSVIAGTQALWQWPVPRSARLHGCSERFCGLAC